MSIAYKNALLGQAISSSGSRDTIVVNSNNDISVLTSSSSGIMSISGTLNATNIRLNNNIVAISGHNHIISDISNLQNTLTALSGISPANSQSSNNLFLWSNFR
jgi:hypothetical protein